MPPLGLRPAAPRGQPDIVPGTGVDASRVYAGGMQNLGYGSTPVSGAPATTSNAGYLVAHGQRLTWPDGTPMTEDDMAGIVAMDQANANEDRNRFDVNTDYSNRSLASVDRERQANVQMAKQKFTEDRRQFDLNNGLNQRKEAASELATGASMRGALNFVQGDMYAQGIAGMNAGQALWLASLRTGQPVQYGGGTATQGNPTPLTVGTLANAMGSGGTSSGSGGGGGTDAYGRPNLSPDVQAAVDSGSQAFQAGLANKPLGWYENMTADQKQGLNSIGSYLGRNVDSEVAYYQRSRPGQGSAMGG